MNPPIGLAYLATYLEKTIGFTNTVIVDGNIENIHERLQKLRPDLIGISSMSLRYGKAIRTAKDIRKYSKAQIVLGGVHISTMPSSMNEAFDFAVIGEGEETFRETIVSFLAKGPLTKHALSAIPGVLLRHSSNDWIETSPRALFTSLDDIPFPNMRYLNSAYFRPREEIGLRKIAICAPLFTARGCPYRCVFCSTSTFWDHYRCHSVPYIIENIRYLVEEVGATVINVMDDMFIVNKKRLGELTKGLRENGLLDKIAFTSTAHSNHIDEEMCKILKELNVGNLNFGFESGSEKILKYLKCGSTSLAKHKEAIRTCKKNGLVVYGSLMFGSPGETLDDMQLTLDFIDFAKKEKADYLWSFVATPFPRTLFWDVAKKKGSIPLDIDWEQSNVMSHHGNENHPPLSDVNPVEFKKVFLQGQKKLRTMRYRLIGRFVLSNPIGVLLLFVKNIPYYIKRLYYYVFRY